MKIEDCYLEKGYDLRERLEEEIRINWREDLARFRGLGVGRLLGGLGCSWKWLERD